MQVAIKTRLVVGRWSLTAENGGAAPSEGGATAQVLQIDNAYGILSKSAQAISWRLQDMCFVCPNHLNHFLLDGKRIHFLAQTRQSVRLCLRLNT